MTSATVDEALQILQCAVRRLYEVPEHVSYEVLNEPLRTYVDYAMSTVQRGQGALDELRPFGLKPGFRYLDAGCAYGGYLAAAAQAGAAEVVGVEVDERFLRIAREFVPALGITARIESGDLCDSDFVRRLGVFDVITCADVIEHVERPYQMLGNLARSLAPGGLLYLATPNAKCPTWVRKDPHFQLFAITLLQPEQARTYYTQMTDCNYYDVGEFHDLDDYISALANEGLLVDLINGPQGDSASLLAELQRDIQQLREAAREFSDSRLSKALQDCVARSVVDWAEQFQRRYETCRGLLPWWPAGGRRLARQLAHDYAVATWHLVARRSP